MDIKSNQIVSESDLIRGCIEKDRRMQEILYNKYAAKMYTVCLRYCKNADDAQDLLQDGFVKVFKSLENYRGDGSFEGWMRRIFVNTSIASFRRTPVVSPITDYQEANIGNNDWDVLDHFDAKDIIKMVQTLSPGYRQVFNMFVIDGYSHKEISVLLGVEEGTSKSQLARAKAAMKEILEAQKIKKQ